MSRPQPLAFQPSAAQQEAAREHAKLLESLDLTRQHRPFRNPAWKPSARRNKNLKQILSEGNRKDAASAAQRAQRQQMQEQQQQQDQEQDQAQKARSTGPGAVTYTNVESAPSLSATGHKRYCDITGLPARYTDPKTRLRYHDREVFAVVRGLAQSSADAYLEARGAGVVLK